MTRELSMQDYMEHYFEKRLCKKRKLPASWTVLHSDSHPPVLFQISALKQNGLLQSLSAAANGCREVGKGLADQVFCLEFSCFAGDAIAVQ